ncbi:type III pantothenate kinase [Povalibacter uvarum]|uniref:Type III pantothenate kinase n=1 Tax=Povalibacter uvarum TaxID=732238 RepID=A0A841HUZ3_9GAMM|nr:type III pantothenate kinase [Povalibacter uvarum]MBB6095645.1 type III pantothenate kinase [Povalibacter uvarum]
MNLLFDIGNTRIKWATLDGGVLSAQRAEPHAEWDNERVHAVVLSGMTRPARVIVSNVGGSRVASLVQLAISTRWGIEPEFVTSTAEACGVRNAYPVPQNLGVDRWLAVIAAHSRSKQLSCIVSCGTAMTIDGVDASGQHLGGVIVPGPGLMVGSLLRNTSDIATRAQQGSTGDALFADNTLGAIHQGAAHSLAALVERAVDSMHRSAGTEPKLLLTGGAAPVIERLIFRTHEAVPDLVLQGLARLSTSRE